MPGMATGGPGASGPGRPSPPPVLPRGLPPAWGSRREDRELPEAAACGAWSEPGAGGSVSSELLGFYA